MSYVAVVPELLTSAATELDDLGSRLSAVNAAAALPTTTMLTAGADDISAAVTALFAGHAQEYQAVSSKFSAFMHSSCGR